MAFESMGLQEIDKRMEGKEKNAARSEKVMENVVCEDCALCKGELLPICLLKGNSNQNVC